MSSAGAKACAVSSSYLSGSSLFVACCHGVFVAQAAYGSTLTSQLGLGMARRQLFQKRLLLHMSCEKVIQMVADLQAKASGESEEDRSRTLGLENNNGQNCGGLKAKTDEEIVVSTTCFDAMAGEYSSRGLIPS